MDIQIKSYEEFANEHKSYDGSSKCFVAGCNKPAYYEGGDARCWCGMCEEHIGLKELYRTYLELIERRIRFRMMWDKGDTTLVPLLNTVTNMLLAVT